MLSRVLHKSSFFFNDTATTEIYTLSLHDALPISWRFRHLEARSCLGSTRTPPPSAETAPGKSTADRDRKSTRLNSSHQIISYAVFCLKKKINNLHHRHICESMSTECCVDNFSHAD